MTLLYFNHNTRDSKFPIVTFYNDTKEKLQEKLTDILYETMDHIDNMFHINMSKQDVIQHVIDMNGFTFYVKINNDSYNLISCIFINQFPSYTCNTSINGFDLYKYSTKILSAKLKSEHFNAT